MIDITQPHDRFVKILLSDPVKAGVLLRERLPKEIAELLSPEPPILVDGSFVDEELRIHLTDRLFQAKTITGRPALLYVLIEHKSFPDRRTGWQVVKYTVAWWKQWERENPNWEMLPPIVPFVFYHGASEWHIPDEFLSLVDAEKGWRPWLLNLRFAVMDLGKIEDRVLSRSPRLRAWLLAAKYATRDGKQLEIKDFFVELLTEVSVDDFMLIMRYVVETYRRYDEKDVREIIRRVYPKEEENMMSQFAQSVIENTNPKWAQMVLQKGRKEGRKDGRKEGEVHIFRRLLQGKFGADLPAHLEEKLKSASLEEIETWTDRLLNAQSLEDVFRG
ncbi:MAG: Rpn family recombination-promoting nuclease/putative transposase [Magnetococcus sp. THC-1_WYH]